MKRVELSDGRVMEFPEATPEKTVLKTVKKFMKMNAKEAPGAAKELQDLTQAIKDNTRAIRELAKAQKAPKKLIRNLQGDIVGVE